MIYTTQEGQSFDPEILRQELVAAIGADGWYLTTAGNQVAWTPDNTATDGFDFDLIEATILTHFNNGAKRDHNSAIQKQIDVLESPSKAPRWVREAALVAMTVGATQQGLTEPQLYAANKGYKDAKDLETAVLVLRGQLQK